MRGAPSTWARRSWWGRLIPAGAGRTSHRRRLGCRRRAHPRRCGAHELVVVVHVGLDGSSPQVRGAPAALRPRFPRPRLIPAGAGRTAERELFRPGRGAHPRRCGAHNNAPAGAPRFDGSSPQVRGARHFLFLLGGAFRLIPAGAGRTKLARNRRGRRWAHPRRCGAHPVNGPLNWAVRGSSPQVRGAQKGHGVA